MKTEQENYFCFHLHKYCLQGDKCACLHTYVLQELVYQDNDIVEMFAFFVFYFSVLGSLKVLIIFINVCDLR